MDETTPALTDASSVQTAAAPVWRRSECCFALVEEHQTVVEDNPEGEWVGIHFTCTNCGKECAPYTSPLLARLAAQAQGKQVVDDA